jgi:hypothetical protein
MAAFRPHLEKGVGGWVGLHRATLPGDHLVLRTTARAVARHRYIFVGDGPDLR